MDIPKELRWIGPLFLILYIILWARRGAGVLVSLLIPFSFFIALFPLQIIGGLIIAFVVFVPRYRSTTLIILLSFLWSGMVIEQLPLPYYGPIPQPPEASLYPFQLYSPILSLISLIINLLSRYPTASLTLIPGNLLLVLLAFLTVLTIELVLRDRINGVVAMLSTVLILMSWTFLFAIFLPYFGPYVHLSPVPLGPLILLNLLPWIKKRGDKTKGFD